MIIPDSFKRAYDEQYVFWETIKREVDGILGAIAGRFSGTSVISRLKDKESAYLKVQRGKGGYSLSELIDFLGATLIVPTLDVIPLIQKDLSEHFEISIARDAIPNPYMFQYNDLHLHVSLKDSPLRSDKSVLNRKFELQIKTLLQAAWSKAGHDIIYKPSHISWGSERIAAQLRALLELADSVLMQIEETARLLHSQSEVTYENYERDAKQIIMMVEKFWPDVELPRDKKRMAAIIESYCHLAAIDVSALNELIQNAWDNSDPLMYYLSIPPMQKIFILLFRANPQFIRSQLETDPSPQCVLITDEMDDLCPDLREIQVGRITI